MGNSSKKTQLELNISREREPDRNFHKGGRSFYFFDLDDNVFFLATPIYIFHKESGEELALSTGEYALHHRNVGYKGPYREYEINYQDNINGSFRRFRDHDRDELQHFVVDLSEAIQKKDIEWMGPSWSCFYHATFNQRPTSLITARGHAPETIKEGVEVLVKKKHLERAPNYLSVYPVTYPETQKLLERNHKKTLSVADLKFQAIIDSVDKAMEVYGLSRHHRFGMSDDDPKNLELIFEAMKKLKEKYPGNSFFVIHTQENGFVKEEVFLDHIKSDQFQNMAQLPLINNED